MSDWIGWLAGALFGAVLAWLLAEHRSRARLDGVRDRSSALEGELALLRQRLGQEEARVGERDTALAAQQRRLAELEQECRGLERGGAELRERVEQERRAAADKLALLEQARQSLADSFRALSSEALRSNNESFLQLARGAFEQLREGAVGDLALRQRAVDELVKPIRESLEKVDGKLGEIERARVGAYSALDEQLKALVNDHLPRLHGETANLVKALRRPEARGRWGEVQLRRVVEMAGMQEHCDFEEQVSVSTEEGRLRPDLIVRLPGGRRIVVDAKAPLDAYMSAVAAEDDETRRRLLEDHARQLRTQIEQLGRKEYLAQFDPTPDFVVLFVPGEAFYSAALAVDANLIEIAIQRRVILASPTTLIGLLKSVSYGWRQEALAQEAQQIADHGRELFKRLGKLAEHWSRVGIQLERAVAAYNDSVGSLESRILPQARRFSPLVGLSGEDIAELNPVERQPRPLIAPELFSPSAEEEGEPGEGRGGRGS
jgi:DNA recombination protein RmuC